MGRSKLITPMPQPLAPKARGTAENPAQNAGLEVVLANLPSAVGPASRPALLCGCVRRELLRISLGSNRVGRTPKGRRWRGRRRRWLDGYKTRWVHRAPAQIDCHCGGFETQWPERNFDGCPPPGAQSCTVQECTSAREKLGDRTQISRVPDCSRRSTLQSKERC